MSDVGEVSPASVFAELQAGEWEDARSAASLPTRLKRQRELCSLTQEELAERSGISLRSIQMYEQRQKNTNRASGLPPRLRLALLHGRAAAVLG